MKWRTMKNMTECARSAVVLDGEKCRIMLIFHKELQRDVRCHPTYSRYIYINDLMVAVEAAMKGVTVGEDTVSGLMFSDDFAEIPETPEGLQKQIEKAL